MKTVLIFLLLVEFHWLDVMILQRLALFLEIIPQIQVWILT